MTKTQAKRECLLLSRYSIAFNYVRRLLPDVATQKKKKLAQRMTELEDQYGFSVDIESDKCSYGEPDAVFTPEEWEIIHARI